MLPDYVRQELDEYLKCGRLEHGFLRVQWKTCHAEHLVAISCLYSQSSAELILHPLNKKAPPLQEWLFVLVNKLALHIEAIVVHYLSPGFNEIINKFLLAIIRSIYLSNSS